MKKIAFYGGSFDPVHFGHLKIAETLLAEFDLDEFVFLPASHAPHKIRQKPTSTYDRYAMLCLATQSKSQVRVSRMEIEVPERPYSVETLTRLTQALPNVEIYFVMGADSWMDITSWREWETVLSLTNHIVVTRPGYPINADHVTDEIRMKIVDRRMDSNASHHNSSLRTPHSALRNIYFTDSVIYDVSATDIRRRIRENEESWRQDIAGEVANYIEKYQIYK